MNDNEFVGPFAVCTLASMEFRTVNDTDKPEPVIIDGRTYYTPGFCEMCTTPIKLPRMFCLECAHDAVMRDEGTYEERMRDAGRGHLLRP